MRFLCSSISLVHHTCANRTNLLVIINTWSFFVWNFTSLCHTFFLLLCQGWLQKAHPSWQSCQLNGHDRCPMSVPWTATRLIFANLIEWNTVMRPSVKGVQHVVHRHTWIPRCHTNFLPSHLLAWPPKCLKHWLVGDDVGLERQVLLLWGMPGEGEGNWFLLPL